MRFLVLAIGMFLTAQAQAQPVEVEWCKPEMPTGLMTCALRNTGTVAVAAIEHSVRVTQPGRAVPWVESMRPAIANISGGMEPGETVEEVLIYPDLPARAEFDNLVFEVTIHQALDVNGAPIE